EAALQQMGPAAVPALIDSVAMFFPSRRKAYVRAIWLLATIDPAPTCAVPALLEIARSPYAFRFAALAALSLLRPLPSRAVVDLLLELYRDRHDPRLRTAAARVLGSIEGELPHRVRDAALVRLYDRHADVRSATYALIDRLPAPDVDLQAALEEMA